MSGGSDDDSDGTIVATIVIIVVLVTIIIGTSFVVHWRNQQRDKVLGSLAASRRESLAAQAESDDAGSEYSGYAAPGGTGTNANASEVCGGNPTFEINNLAFDSSSSSTQNSSGAAHSGGSVDTGVSLAAAQGAVVAVTAGDDKHEEYEFVQVRRLSINNNHTPHVQVCTTFGSGMQTTYTGTGTRNGHGGADFTRGVGSLQHHVIVSDGIQEVLIPLDTSTGTSRFA